MASSADRRTGDGTPAPRGECSDQRLVGGRPARRRRVVDGVPATHCTWRQPEAATGRRRRAVVVLVGRSGTAPCVRRRRRNHRNSNVFSCRRVTATTGCRPATAPGTAQRPPARTRASEPRNSDTFLLVRCLAVISQLVSRAARRLVSRVTAPKFSPRQTPQAAINN